MSSVCVTFPPQP